MADINAEDLPLVAEGEASEAIGLDINGEGCRIPLDDYMTNKAAAIRTLTADTTLTADMRGEIIEVDSSSARTITVPASLTDWPALVPCIIHRKGTGTVTIAAGAGATLLSAGKPKLRVQQSAAFLYKLDSTRWLLTGDTTA